MSDRIGVGQLRGLDVVHLADGARVHPDLPGRCVHQPLDDKNAFRPARAAIGTDRRGVGHHRFDLVMHQRQVVHATLHERTEHQRNDVGSSGHVSAGAADRAHAIGQHAALGVERKFAGRCEVAAMAAADEFVRTVAAPAHLAPEFHRGVSDHAVLGIEIGLLPKTAADIADQHPHALLWPLQHGFGQYVAGRARRLGLHVQDQSTGFFIHLGDGAARLHRGGNQPLADYIERNHMRGLCESGFDRSRVAIAHRRHDIVWRAGPYNRCTWFDCGNGIDDRRQHFIFDNDRFHRGLRGDTRCRHHGSDRLAGEAYDFMREKAARRHRHRRAVRPLENRQRRKDADIVGDQVGACVHGLDA
jgi:hypothetical protein